MFHFCLVAIPIGTMVSKPKICDIFTYLQRDLGNSHLPSKITEDEPNYLLHFANKSDLEVVEAKKAIRTPTYALAFVKWTPFYKYRSTPWRNPISVEIDGIPPEICGFPVLKSLLGSFCEVSGYKFNETTQKTHVYVYASSSHVIPTTGIIALPVANVGIDIPEIKQVSMKSTPIPNELDDEKTIQEYVSQGYPRSVVRTGTLFTLCHS